jgi:predicted DNA binding CopG/RHH family protein
MPNAPKTPTRTIRVSDELWTAVQRKAATAGITVTSIILAALNDYVEEPLDNEN